MYLTYIVFNPQNKHVRKVFKEKIICSDAHIFLNSGDRIWTQFCLTPKSFFFHYQATFQLRQTHLCRKMWVSQVLFTLGVKWNVHFCSQSSFSRSIFWTSRQATICKSEHLVRVAGRGVGKILLLQRDRKQAVGIQDISMREVSWEWQNCLKETGQHKRDFSSPLQMMIC